MRRLLASLALLLSVPVAGLADDDTDRLAAYLSGFFTSAAQAEADSAYYAVTLDVAPIWPDAEDGRWLYVEQAMAARPEAPYRQRLYRITREDDGRFASAIFTLADPEAAVGGARDPERLAGLTRDDVEERVGCTVYLDLREDGSFEGSTDGKSCPSQLRGATYATSQVRVFADRVESWDQGFDEDDEQVWGAVAGPYVFLRVRED